MFIFLPLLLLAALGVYGVQASRRAALERLRAQLEAGLDEVLAPALDDLGQSLANGAKPYPLAPIPAAPDDAQRLYAEALAMPPADAEALLARLAGEHRDALSESGIPLLPLIEFARLRATTDGDAGKQLSALGDAAVFLQPSVLTPRLLAGAEALLQERGIELDQAFVYREKWERDEKVRAPLRRYEEQLARVQRMGWIGDGQDLRFIRRDAGTGELRIFMREHLAESVALPAARRIERLAGSGVDAEVRLAGVPLLDSPPGNPLARAERDGLMIAALLNDPARFYVEQQRQALLLGALLACAVATSLAGFWTMQRSLARERELESRPGAGATFTLVLPHQPPGRPNT